VSHWNIYTDMSKTYTDEDGNEQYGLKVWGFRDPADHSIHFSDVTADQPAPEYAPGEEAPAPRRARRQAPEPAQEVPQA
jgi:hypothetical protein